MSTNNSLPVHFFSENLKYLLKRFGVSQAELAFHIERKQTTVSNWINGNSVPDVDDLVKVYHFFGFGMDALILMDMSESRLITDKYITSFEKLHNTEEADIVKNILQEPEPVFNQSVLGQLKDMDAKLDSLQAMTRKLVDREKKPVTKPKG